MTRWRWLGRAVALALSALVVWILARTFGGGAAVLRSLVALELRWLLAALALSFGCILLGVARWQRTVHLFGHRLPFGRGLRATLAAWPLVLVAPSRSNELLRALPVRDLVPGTVGAASIVTEKVVDLVVLLLLAAAGTAATRLFVWAALLALAAAALVALAAAGSRPEEGQPGLRWAGRLRPWLLTSLTGLRTMRQRPLQALAVGALSLVIRAATVAVLLLLLLAAGAKVDWVTAAAVAPAAMAAGLLPFTLTGIGPRDAVFLYLLSAAGAHVADATPVLAATLAYSVVATWAFAVVGLPLMVSEGLRRAAASPAAPSTESASAAPPTEGAAPPDARGHAR